MDGRTPRSNPDRKISETFLRFAAPILHDLPSEVPEHRAREALRVSFTAWNAVVFADVLNDHRYLDEIRRLTADKAETALLMEQLIARKRGFFAEASEIASSRSAIQALPGCRWSLSNQTSRPLRRRFSTSPRVAGVLAPAWLRKT